MKLSLKTLNTMTVEDIKRLISAHGSVFVSKLKDDCLLVQHLFVSDESITSLEYSPNEQFTQIKPNVWFREYILPKVINFCYWLYKNCDTFKDELDERRDECLIKDVYSKNVLNFYNEKGEVFANQTYILPVPRFTTKIKLQREEILFNSRIMQNEFKIVIEYPKKINKVRNFKILIVTDGEIWANTMHLGQNLDKQKINIIVCYIFQNNRNQELPMNKKFCQFICDELVEFLAGHFNIKNDKSMFIFCGQSYGGLTALYIDMFFKNKIEYIVCQSPSLWFDKKNEIVNYYKKNEINGNLTLTYGNCERPFITEKAFILENTINKNSGFKTVVFSGGHDYVSWFYNLLDVLKHLTQLSN